MWLQASRAEESAHIEAEACGALQSEMQRVRVELEKLQLQLEHQVKGQIYDADKPPTRQPLLCREGQRRCANQSQYGMKRSISKPSVIGVHNPSLVVRELPSQRSEHPRLLQ